MTWQEFDGDPWKKSHKAYSDAFFAIKPAPEYASGEVLISSLYRRIGFSSISESEVPAEGRQFEKGIRKNSAKVDGPTDEIWRTVVHRVLESPKLPNQASKPYLQLTPLVPEVALYSGSARRSGNSWPAGRLVEALVVTGAAGSSEANEIWARLFDGLSVQNSDDIWARWLQIEFARRRVSQQHSWELNGADIAALPGMEGIRVPARQFVRDLKAILDAKSSLTRAQWISLLGAIVRLGGAAHVLWLCDIHDRLWRYLRRCIVAGSSTDLPTFLDEVFPAQISYLEYGKPAVPVIRDFANKYLTARLGINAVLWLLPESGKLDTPAALHELATRVSARREKLKEADFFGKLSALQEREARTLGCKKGIGSNMVEFGRHVLGQRQSATDVLRGYDQAFFLRKKGTHASAPWVVSLGPAALISLVHCCLHDAGGPRSVHRLAQHLEAYGIRTGIEDLLVGDLGSKLRLLGLVLDSPDAETGMLLVPPVRVTSAGDKP